MTDFSDSMSLIFRAPFYLMGPIRGHCLKLVGFHGTVKNTDLSEVFTNLFEMHLRKPKGTKSTLLLTDIGTEQSGYYCRT